ncbi:MAG: winged helix-turn-helix transcriptional regulator [Alphaproteobacteria bacterium]|nr:winged helix-turn-helix transcriptional regulator [Alphaproteobacteria bacterium]
MPELPDTFAALGEPTRLAIVRLLSEQPLRSSEIAEALQVSRAVASRHLRVLDRAGLVTASFSEADARARVYALSRDPLRDVRAFLDELEAFWGDQLAAFQAWAEEREP